MAKNRLRKITIDGSEYLWKFDPGYRRIESPAQPYECHDTFTAWLAQSRTSPLRVHFTAPESPAGGGPLRHGGPLASGGPSSGINLHTPKWAATLIQLARKKGWTPELPAHALLVEDGLPWLAEVASSVR
jgi:hypothetical protein